MTEMGPANIVSGVGVSVTFGGLALAAAEATANGGRPDWLGLAVAVGGVAITFVGAVAGTAR